MGRTERDYAPYLAAAVSGTLLILGAASYLFWRDAGELSAAAVDMGVPHPTGFSLWTGAGRVLGFIPFGSLDLRFALLSVLPLMLSIALASSLCGRILRAAALVIPPAVDLVLRGVALPLLVLSSDTAYYLACTPEVYALAALITMAHVGLCFGEEDEGRSYRAAGAFLGLAPSVHVTAGLGFLATLLTPLSFGKFIDREALKRFFRGGMLPFLLALGGVWALVLTAGNNPELNFGNPNDLGGLWQHLTGATIQEAFSAAGSKGLLEANLDAHLAFLFSDLGIFSLVCACLAFSFCRHQLLVRRLWILVLLDFSYSLWMNPMGRSDLQTGLLTVLGIVTLACVGLAHLSLFLAQHWRHQPTRALLPFASILVLLVVRAPVVDASWDDRLALGHDDTALRLQRVALHPLRSSTVVFTASDDLISTTLSARLVEGRRPDLTQVITPYAWWPWRIDGLGDGTDLKELREASNPEGYEGLAPSDPQQRAIVREWLRWANRKGSIAWQAGQPIFDELLGERIHAHFPFAPVQAEPLDRLRWGERRLNSLEALAGLSSRHRWSRQTLSDGHRINATVAARKGNLEKALSENRRAIALDSQNGRAFGNMGVLQLRAGDKEGARASLKKASNLRPHDPRIWRNLALTHFQLGEIELARRALSESVAVGSGPEDELKSDKLRTRLGL